MLKQFHNVSKNKSFFYVIYTIFVAVFPVMVFLSYKAADVVFYIIVMCSLLVLLFKKDDININFVQLLKKYWPLFLSMAGFFIAEFLNQIFVNKINFALYNQSLIFLFFPIILFGLLHISISNLKCIHWGLILASLTSFCIMLIISDMGEFRQETWRYVGTHIIPFTSLSIMVGFLSLLSIKWDGEKNILLKSIKIIAFVLTIFVSYISQTRGVWLSIALIGIVIFFFGFNFNKKNALMFFVLSLILISIFSFNKKIQSRIALAKYEVGLYLQDSNKPTSIGFRLELYKASWTIFKENPWFGVGPKNYVNELRKMINDGRLIKDADIQGGHGHNEFLHRMALYGIWGWIIVFSYTFVPLYYFWKERKKSDNLLKAVSIIGIVFSLGFLFFGFTDIIFYRRQVNAFYTVIMAVLFALLIKGKEKSLNVNIKSCSYDPSAIS